MKAQLAQVMEELRDAESALQLHRMQDGVLKNEIRELQRKQGREGANMEVSAFAYALSPF